MRSGYRTNLWPGETPGTWCYEVVTPEGHVSVRGARSGSKQEVQDHLRKFTKRANLDGGYQAVGLTE